MSNAALAKRVEGIWSGYGKGTNRGKILMRIKRSPNTANGLTSKAILYDEQFGITEAWLSGLISGGDKAEFRLLDVRGLAPLVPRDGQVVLNLKEDGTAEGQWHTDIGTAGEFRISRATFGAIGWYRHVLSAKAWFAWHKWLAPIYGCVPCRACCDQHLPQHKYLISCLDSPSCAQCRSFFDHSWRN